MTLTDKQSARLEAAIVRYIREIPSIVEIDIAKQWLGGLQIEWCEQSSEYEYLLRYTWEDEQNRLRGGHLSFNAHFIDDTVEDIRFKD